MYVDDESMIRRTIDNIEMVVVRFKDETVREAL